VTWFYCDPPYVPLSTTASFTSYATGGFSVADQEELAELVREAAQKGALIFDFKSRHLTHEETLWWCLFNSASPCATDD